MNSIGFGSTANETMRGNGEIPSQPLCTPVCVCALDVTELDSLLLLFMSTSSKNVITVSL